MGYYGRYDGPDEPKHLTITDLLYGKLVSIDTDVMVKVNLEIQRVEEVEHSEQLEKGTPENDWWPKTKDWTTFDVTFTNGFKKSYPSISELLKQIKVGLIP